MLAPVRRNDRNMGSSKFGCDIGNCIDNVWPCHFLVANYFILL